MRMAHLLIIILLLVCFIKPTVATEIAVLTSGPALDSHPFWSPDGKSVIFISMESGNPDIWIISSNGENKRPLTLDEAWEFFVGIPWSPDGKYILYISNEYGAWDLWKMNSDGTEKTELTKGSRIIPGLPLSGYGADWSSDGKQIVYTSCLFENKDVWEAATDTSGNRSNTVNLSIIRKEADIWVMNADGSSKRRLTTGGDARSPQWQPYGDKIAYLSDISGYREIWNMSNDGTEKMQVTFSEGNVSEYAWSPNGYAIVYVVATPLGPATGAEFSIWVTNADRSGAKQLTAGNWDGSPIWSPDGSRIAFKSMSRNQAAIWVVNSDGSDLIPLTPGNLTYMMQQWSPDGKTIVVSDGNDLYAILLNNLTAFASPGFEAFFVVAALLLLVYMSKRRS